MIWEWTIMNDMRMWYYEWSEKIELWMIWENRIMNDMRKSNYEWYEKIKLWMIWEYQIMNDMRISNACSGSLLRQELRGNDARSAAENLGNLCQISSTFHQNSIQNRPKWRPGALQERSWKQVGFRSA